MRCIVYHSNPIDVNANIVSHGKNKGLMRYNKNHGTSSLKNHVFHEDAEKGKRQDFLFEKTPLLITKFFGSHWPYNKTNLTQHAFFEDMVLYIAKGYHLMSFIENSWSK